MAGPQRVEWTPEALEQLERIHAFVLHQWNERIADRFLMLVMEFEDLILRYPKGFQRSTMHPDLRMGPIHRNVKARLSGRSGQDPDDHIAGYACG